MKKTLILLLISIFSINSFASSEFNEKKFETFKAKFKYEYVKKLPDYKNYIKDTGADKESLNIDSKNAWLNEDWKKGMYYILVNKKEFTSVYSKTKGKKLSMPDYQKALEYFNLAVKKTKNPFIAYQGLNIILNNYMQYAITDIAKIYMRTFSKELTRRNFCLGYLYFGRSYMQEISSHPNYEKAYKIFKNGKEKCLKDNIPNYIYHSLRTYKVKASTMKDIAKGR
jgi:hypothetical protein